MTAPAPTVDRGTLVLDRLLGQGGQGVVHRVANRRINEADGDGWEVVYKEYDPALLPVLDADALTAMVGLLGDLSGSEGRWLCEKTAWPAAVVRHEGRTSGFLMRAAPDRFHFDLRSLGNPAATTRRLANLEFLLNDDAYVAGIGLAVSERDRLLLLADLAATLGRLHRIGITVGDLSPKNLLFTTAGRPECFLIDCDATRLRGASVLPQAETPDWQLPAGEEKATPAGDVHKLALLAIRLFARDQTTTDPAALAAVSPALGDLALAGLDPDPSRRPTPGLWAEHLGVAAVAASSAPAAAPGVTGPGGPPPGPPPAGPGGTPQGPTAPPTPTPKSPVAVGIGVIALLAAAVMAIVFVQSRHDSGSDPDLSVPTVTTSYSTVPLPAPASPKPPKSTPADPPYTAPAPVHTPTYTPPPTTPDMYESAEVGSCFYDNGTSEVAKLSPTACTTGAFKVLRIFNGTTNLDSCKNITDYDESVSSRNHNLVLCLTYLSPGGDAFHADQGDCVYGPNSTGPWGKTSCQRGAFSVLASYRGTTDHAKCDSWPNYNLSKTFTVPGNSTLDVLLCLSYTYPDAIGYAKTGACLLKSGSETKPVFSNVSSCSAANIVVAGRTNAYHATSFCGQYGWTTLQVPDYPYLDYTVCWRWR
ncbi:hypothetical protein [Kitasatospora sp. NPDC091207]|uniref:LppU/SCO3897 family protein n=1 Tax=Kitasatospora sp. NPDC091207 TaxID=3364083 RepID=UPI00380DA001